MNNASTVNSVTTTAVLLSPFLLLPRYPSCSVTPLPWYYCGITIIPISMQLVSWHDIHQQ